MSFLETISGFVMSLSAPAAEYLSEKLATRFGGNKAPGFAIQVLVFTLVFFPLLLLAVLLLGCFLLMLHGIFAGTI